MIGIRVPRLRGAEDGTATVEFAIVATTLCTLLLGMVDFGVGFWQQMQVANAAKAGADYIMANGYDSTSVANAITSATGLSGITPNSSTTCGCPTTSGVSAGSGTYPACGSSCTGGGTSMPYVTVTASVSYSPFVSWPGISSPITLTATAFASN